MKYTVYVHRKFIYKKPIEVDADSPAEAKNKAMDAAIDWHFTGGKSKIEYKVTKCISGRITPKRHQKRGRK